MKIYKDYMDEMKAPEELIQKTRAKMHEAETLQNAASKEAETLQNMVRKEPEPVHIQSSGKPARKKTHPYFYLVGACLAACLAILFMTDLSAPAGDAFRELVWNTVCDDGVRAPEDPANSPTVIEAPAVPSNLDPSAIFPSFELVQERLDQGVVLFFLRREDTSVLYQAGSTAGTIPQQLLEVQPQDFNGTSFFLGVSDDGRTNYIAWQQDDLWFLITAKDITEEDLIQTLTKVSEK